MSTLFTASGLLTLFGILGWVAAGVMGALGIFNKSARETRRENDQVTQDLITNLRTTVDELKGANTELNKKREAQNERVAHLEGQLLTLEKVLQGRDPQQASFFKESPMLFAIARENNELAKTNSKALSELTDAIASLLNRMSPVITLQPDGVVK